MILQKIIQFVKEHLDDIILVVGVILISLLSFAAGYIVARQQEKEPIQFEEKVDEDSFICPNVSEGERRSLLL